ncbi:MAG: cation:proton antiporter [Hyphomicrobiaceae bacterium]
MSLFHVIGLIVTLVALFGYLNHRFIGLPDIVGITAMGLIASMIVTAMGAADPDVSRWATATMREVDFSEIVFHGLLGMLLFAGSLHVNLAELAGEKWIILVLATAGVVLSTVLVGMGLYYTTPLLGIGLPFIYCLLFGALIAPTDPIAVLGLLRQARVEKSLQTRIAGESLFNDGTGVVLFLTLLGLISGAGEPSVPQAMWLLVREVAGGLIFGIAAGLAGFYLLKSIDSYAVEILITLSMATAGYSAAEALHVSAPIAVVVMGLIVGNHGKRFAMSERTRAQLFSFWELIDELLNLLLFGLIGLEVIALSLSARDLLPALIAIPIVLAARGISVALPIGALRQVRQFSPHTIKLMTWGGLRGGISIALALSLPVFPGREIVIAATYVVVIFSILVQALTMGPLVRWLGASAPAPHHGDAT